MKSFFKILSAALLLCAFAVSCGGDSTEPDPEPTPNPPAPVEDDKIVIPEGTNLSPTLSQDGGSQTVRFTAKQPWQARVDDTRAAADWLHVAPASGGAGEAELSITADPNDATDDREGYVKIVSGNSQVTFSITQKQRDALTVSPSKRAIGANETEFEVEVRANLDFQVEVQADWIEQISTRAMTTTVLKFRAKRNIGDERTGAIVIRSGEKSETITVTQEKGEFIVDTEQFHIDAAAQSVSAKVRANIDFEVKSQASWIHYNPTRALTSYTLAFDIDENTTGKERTGEITISSGEKSETITVVQSDAVFDVEFDQTEVSHEGGIITATVNSNLEYAVVLPGDVDWLTSTDTRAVTTQKHSFKIEANPNVEPRSAIIKFVYQSEKGEAEKQVIITQQASGIQADPNLYELDADGGQVEVRVQGNTASSSDIKYQITQGAEWISCVETRAATAYFTFKVDKNTTGKPREGEIVFTLPDQTGTKVRIVQSETAADNTNIIHFPDANFKAYIRRFDKNRDGEISEYEASLITDISCSDKDIQSLEGIEYCTALRRLNCEYNQLTALDVSNNTKLETLYCSYNQLTALDVSNNTKLDWLDCHRNQLTTLEVRNNTKLETLDCGSNQLTTLDVSGCSALLVLYCEINQLTSLDVSKNTALTSLGCYSNQLTALDVSNNTKLDWLNCHRNQLTTLEVRNNTKLGTLYCSYNQLTTLEVRNNTALTDLGCDENQLTALDVRNNTALRRLDCYSNQLTALDVSKNTALTELGCSSNPLEMLNLGDAVANIDDYLGLGSSTKLKVIGTKITKLNVSANKLQSLDVSKCPALTELSCGDNPIEVLNLGDAVANIDDHLTLGSSTKLKVIGTKITKLNVLFNNLQSLDVSECPALTHLDCGDNQLTTLDVSKTNLGNSTETYPLNCVGMFTLKTLYLKTGWKINGINVGRSTSCIPDETEILYKD